MSGPSPVWALWHMSGTGSLSRGAGQENDPWGTSQQLAVIHALSAAIVFSCFCLQGVLWLSPSVTESYFLEIYGFWPDPQHLFSQTGQCSKMHQKSQSPAIQGPDWMPKTEKQPNTRTKSNPFPGTQPTKAFWNVMGCRWCGVRGWVCLHQPRRTWSW